MTHPELSFSSLPIESQNRILIDAHNGLVEERRVLIYDNKALKLQVDDLKKKLSAGTDHEIDKLKSVCELQCDKIGRQEKRIKDLERLLNFN